MTLRFGGVSALSDVSFDVRKGEILSIIGPNGAGKSSMLNVINGFYRAQQGTIVHKGRTIRHMRPYRAAVAGIGRTFQNIALFRGMTTLDNLMTGSRYGDYDLRWLLQAMTIDKSTQRLAVQWKGVSAVEVYSG